MAEDERGAAWGRGGKLGQRPGSAMERSVVVGGVGRSGTSLVQAMLHAHPDLVFLPETHFFRRYVGPLLRRIRVERAGVEGFAGMLEQDEQFARAGIAAQELLAPFADGSASFEPGGAYLRLLRLHRQRHEARVVGDKDPRLIDFLPVLDRVLPDVRVVHVIRDPRDVLLSRRKAAWSRGRSDWSHLLAYRAQMCQAKRTGARVLGDRYLEVRYEDLLQEPEQTLIQLCRHVDLEFDPAMMSFSDGAKDLVGDDEWQWKKETTGPLMRDNMRKWEEELEPAVRMLTEKVCIEPFPGLGYAPSERSEAGDLSTGRRAMFACAELLAKAFSRAYPLRTLAG